MSGLAQISLGMVLCLALLSSCKTTQENSEEESSGQNQPTTVKIPIGFVHLVDEEGNFVLIKSSRMTPVEPGAAIVTIAESGLETAYLTASEARKGTFLTADVVTGAPMVGDRAVLEHAYQSPDQAQGAAGSGRDAEIQVLE